MPKEVIKSDRLIKNSHVTVGWTADQGVQLGVGLGSSFVFIDKTGKVMDDPDEPDSYKDLWFTFDNRSQINDLIRNLRKARDSAYGRDE